MKLLFIVHRTAPYNGGSEVYVQAMAEEAHRRGHEVAIFSGEHKGDYNGIRITSDANILLLKWDLIIIHGFGPSLQNFVLSNARNIPSPILYMLILPSNNPQSIQALNDCAYLGWSTLNDINHLRKYNVANKSVRVRHGINHIESLSKPGFKEKYGITKRMFLSAGGYWPNKLMKELAEVFVKANIDDAVLVTTGYDNKLNLMPDQIPGKVIPMLIDDRKEILSAISEAECYLMHSNQEGFGLVILESMLNRTPWIARHIAGPAMLKDFGKTYGSDNDLIALLQNFNRNDFDLDRAEMHVLNNHLINHTINDIEAVAMDAINKRSK